MRESLHFISADAIVFPVWLGLEDDGELMHDSSL